MASENEVLTSRQILTWDLRAFVTTDSLLYTYNADGNPDTIYMYKLTNNVWNLDGKRSFMYDENKKLKEDMTERFIAEAWKNSTRNQYILDGNDNIIDSTYFTWNDTTTLWVENYKTSSTFNTEGQKILALGQRWQNNNWSNNRYYTYQYNAQNKLDTVFGKSWRQGSWRNNSIVVYTYDGNSTEAITKTYFGQNLTNFMKIVYTYTEEYLSEMSNYLWQNNDWVLQEKQKFLNDENENLINILIQKSETIGWLTNNRNTYFYDGNNNKARDLAERLINNVWQNYRRTNFSYDVSNKLTEETNQLWSATSGSWSNLDKTEYFYDNNSKLQIKYNYTWKSNQTWIYNTSSTFSYDDTENTSVVTNQRYIDSNSTWQNTTKTSSTFNIDGKLVDAITENWNVLNLWWKNATRSSSTFDESGYLTQTIDYRWIVSWNEDFKRIYTNDVNGNKIVEFGQDKRDTVWVDSLQYHYKYDNENRLTEQLYIRMRNSQWDSTEKQMFFYGEPTPIGVFEPSYNVSELFNYPNPFSNETIIGFRVTNPGVFNLNLFDEKGYFIGTIGEGYFDSGEHEVEFYAGLLPSGIYYLSLIGNNQSIAIKKLVIIK